MNSLINWIIIVIRRVVEPSNKLSNDFVIKQGGDYIFVVSYIFSIRLANE